MSEAVRRYSFLNRWYVFKRRDDRRPPIPQEIPAPPILTEFVTRSEANSVPKSRLPTITERSERNSAVSEVIEMGPAAAAAPPPAGAGAGALPPVSEVKEGANIPQLNVTELGGESTQYIVNLDNPEPDMRLGAAYADWPRYLSLGMWVDVPDVTDPAIVYPSLEAAIASAKYQRATLMPGAGPNLGPQLFKVGGTIHQGLMAKADRPAAMKEEVSVVRTASGKAKMTAQGVTWNPEMWTVQRETVYKQYLAKRHSIDERFREMLSAIRTKGGEILYANGKVHNDLGVGIKADGSVSDVPIGAEQNMIGRWMMEL
jgi:hypothetical protein